MTSFETCEHRDVPATTWKLPALKSVANCNACHTQAKKRRVQ